MMNSTSARPPIAYHISFCTYASWQPGDGPGTPASRELRGRNQWVPPDPTRLERFRQPPAEAPFVIEDGQRAIIAASIKDICAFRGWELLAGRVRAREVQVVVRHAVTPERMMTDMKARATRALRQAGLIGPERRVWARHGSTLYLFHETDVEHAITSCKGAGSGAPAAPVIERGTRSDGPDLLRARHVVRGSGPSDAGEVGLGGVQEAGVAVKVERGQGEGFGSPHRVLMRFG